MSTSNRKRRKAKRWTFSAGEKGCMVTVEERRPGGTIYARAFDLSLRSGRGGYRRVSLKHRDRERATTYALEQAAKLRAGIAEIATGKVTLARLLALYETHRTPRKTASEQLQDARRIALWTRVLGGHKDPHHITLAEWEGFIDARTSGAIDPHGKPVPADKRRSVRPRTVEADCDWLRWVLNWGHDWRDPATGRYLLRENPVRGYEAPKEKNPRRPVATQDRFEAVRAVSDRIEMELRLDGAERQRSYLSDILDILNGTGRRISAVVALRYEDLRLERTKTAPHGAIRWPAETDKQRKEWTVPISANVRAAIDRVVRERPGVGAAYLFPSPTAKGEPVPIRRVREWLLKAEKLAKLPKQQGSLFHAYRRKWASERKHLPDVDVAAAGGWSSTVSLKRSYQQADEATMLQVVESGAELREKQA